MTKAFEPWNLPVSPDAPEVIRAGLVVWVDDMAHIGKIACRFLMGGYASGTLPSPQPLVTAASSCTVPSPRSCVYGDAQQYQGHGVCTTSRRAPSLHQRCAVWGAAVERTTRGNRRGAGDCRCARKPRMTVVYRCNTLVSQTTWLCRCGRVVSLGARSDRC